MEVIPLLNKRSKGRPRMRWIDETKREAGVNWNQDAQDGENGM